MTVWLIFYVIMGAILSICSLTIARAVKNCSSSDTFVATKSESKLATRLVILSWVGIIISIAFSMQITGKLMDEVGSVKAELKESAQEIERLSKRDVIMDTLIIPRPINKD